MEVGSCTVCRKENSTAENPVVFCPQCRKAYHRFCHRPPVDRIYVAVKDAEWFCHECIGQQHPELALETGVPSTDIEPETRKEYLLSLTKTQLVYLLQFAETIDPSLPIYSPHTSRDVARLEQENADMRHIEFQMRPGNEDLVVQVVSDHARSHAQSPGVTMLDIWRLIEEGGHVKNGPNGEALDASFKHAATRALQRALRKGRLVERAGRFLPNSDYQPSSESHLKQLLKGDDNVMFSHMPLRLRDGQETAELLKSDTFSQKVYVH